MAIAAQPKAASIISFLSMSEVSAPGTSHDCPNEVDQKQLDELHIQIVKEADS